MVEFTFDPEIDDRCFEEYLKKLNEWKKTQDAAERVARAAREISDLSFSFTSDNPDVYAEVWDAFKHGKTPTFWEMFEALPIGAGTFKVRLRRGTIQ
jgi:hypothetical protein